MVSICSFSIKIVSVRSQLPLRTVRSTSSEFPTRLKSGCVLVASGVLVQQSELYIEHVKPSAFRRRIVRKRIVRVGPRVPLAPESVHKGVHEFDLRTSVQFGGQQLVQFTIGRLKNGIIIARLHMSFAIADLGGIPPPLSVPT